MAELLACELDLSNMTVRGFLGALERPHEAKLARLATDLADRAPHRGIVRSDSGRGKHVFHVGLWHIAEVRGCYILGPVTAA